MQSKLKVKMQLKKIYEKLSILSDYEYLKDEKYNLLMRNFNQRNFLFMKKECMNILLFIDVFNEKSIDEIINQIYQNNKKEISIIIFSKGNLEIKMQKMSNIRFVIVNINTMDFENIFPNYDLKVISERLKFLMEYEDYKNKNWASEMTGFFECLHTYIFI